MIGVYAFNGRTIIKAIGLGRAPEIKFFCEGPLGIDANSESQNQGVAKRQMIISNILICYFLLGL